MFLTRKEKKELEASIKRHPAKGKTPVTIVYTETGSVYEFDFNQMRVRRINETGNFSNLRKDEEWLELVTVPEIELGQSMRFALMIRDDGIVTLRTTSYVIKVEKI
jgi:hypothetical protein